MGDPLKWDLLNADGRRIFRKGFVLNTEQAVERLQRMELYYDATADSMPPELAARTQRTAKYDFGSDTEAHQHLHEGHIFLFLDYCIYQTRLVSERIVSGSVKEKDNILNIASNIELLFEKAEEACIGAIHLEFEEHPYSSMHPVYTALLCLVMAKALGYTKGRRISLLAAALTANLGMYEVHDDFVNKSDGLSDDEFARMKKHPELSCRYLEANGVKDKLWLRIVMQSHERMDGKGYPQGLSADQICHEARIYSVIDTYLAMVMPRAYRSTKLPKLAMREIYKMAVAEKDAISVGLIKQLGVYPPGSCVLIDNDQIGIVIERNLLRTTCPQVAIVATLDGQRIRPTKYVSTTNDNYKVVDAIGSHYIKGVDPTTLWTTVLHTERQIKSVV